MTLSRRAWLRGAGGVACAAGAAAAGLARATAAGSDVQVLRPRIEALPPVALTTMNGQPRRLDIELRNTRPLLLNFVFTTCSSSCSVQTAVLAQLQRRLAAGRRPVQIASITIDPDNDTPEQLRRFAAQFGVGAGWEFYTGRFDDLLSVQKHFDVYRGSKAAHPPVILLRRDARSAWLRIEGFPAADDLMRLLERLPAADP